MIEENENTARTDETGQEYPVGVLEGEGEEVVEEEEAGEEEAGEPAGVEAPPEARLTVAAQEAGEALRRLGERVGAGAQGLVGKVGEGLEPPGTEQAPPTDSFSDLFEGPQPYDADVYIQDLVTVPEESVMGDGPSDMSDLLEVTDEDIEARPEDFADLLEVSEEDILGIEKPPQEQAPTTALPGYRPRQVTRLLPPPTGVSQVQQ